MDDMVNAPLYIHLDEGNDFRLGYDIQININGLFLPFSNGPTFNSLPTGYQYHDSPLASLCNWAPCRNLFHPCDWQCENGKKQAGKKGATMSFSASGILSFSDDKKGRLAAKTIMLVHSWLYPPINNNTGKQLWVPGDSSWITFPETMTSYMDTHNGYVLGFVYINNVILIKYEDGLATDYLIYNRCHPKQSGWTSLPGLSVNV
jgi:hypothetical protein